MRQGLGSPIRSKMFSPLQYTKQLQAPHFWDQRCTDSHGRSCFLNTSSHFLFGCCWMRAGGRRSPTGFEVIFSPGPRLESDTAIPWGGPPPITIKLGRSKAPQTLRWPFFLFFENFERMQRNSKTRFYHSAETSAIESSSKSGLEKVFKS